MSILSYRILLHPPDPSLPRQAFVPWDRLLFAIAPSYHPPHQRLPRQPPFPLPWNLLREVPRALHTSSGYYSTRNRRIKCGYKMASIVSDNR